MGSCRCHNEIDDCHASGRSQKNPSSMCNSFFHSHTAVLVTSPRLLPVVPACLKLLCNAPGSAWEPLLQAAWGPCGQNCLGQPAPTIIAVFSVPWASLLPFRTPNGHAGYEKCFPPNSFLLSNSEGKDGWTSVLLPQGLLSQQSSQTTGPVCTETPIPQRNMGELLPAWWRWSEGRCCWCLLVSVGKR